MPVQEPKAAPAPVVQPVTAPPPEPYDNEQSINAHAAFKDHPLEHTPKSFFLFCGAENAKVAASYWQRGIGIPTWHPEYAKLPIFQNAERIWVVLGSEHVPSVCKHRLQTTPKRYSEMSEDFRRWYGADFERIHHFQPFPLPSHVQELDALVTCDADRAFTQSIAQDIWV